MNPNAPYLAFSTSCQTDQAKHATHYLSDCALLYSEKLKKMSKAALCSVEERICNKSFLALFSAETHPTSKFCGNLSSSFSVIVLTNTDVSSFKVSVQILGLIKSKPYHLQQAVIMCLQHLFLSSLRAHHCNHEDELIL